MVRIIDSHCHPQFPQYDPDRPEVVERALKEGVGMICVGTDLNNSRQAIELADRYEGIWSAIGLHPNENDAENENYLSVYESLLKHPKVVAMGEIGLDYYRTTESAAQEIQRKRFIEQLKLAQKAGLPVIIHCRDKSASSAVGAHLDIQKILPEGIAGVMHSFNGSADLASIYIGRGLYIGLNAIVTFSKEYHDMVRSIPIEKLLLETDAPYLAPAPYRGKRNEPAYVLETARMIADIRNEDTGELISRTTENARRLFRL